MFFSYYVNHMIASVLPGASDHSNTNNKTGLPSCLPCVSCLNYQHLPDSLWLTFVLTLQTNKIVSMDDQQQYVEVDIHEPLEDRLERIFG